MSFALKDESLTHLGVHKCPMIYSQRCDFVVNLPKTSHHPVFTCDLIKIEHNEEQLCNIRIFINSNLENRRL